MYLIIKTIHVLAVVMFLGNITTGLFWKAHGDKTGDPRIMAHTLHGIIRSDRWFTLPGVVLILVTGFWGAGVGGLAVFATGWIWVALILFGLSGLAFGVVVAPMQSRLHRLAKAGAETGNFDRERYRRWSLQWELWGLFALLTPLAALVLMVLKPGL